MSLSFVEKGKGFPVVLLHGFCETHRIWDQFADELSNEFRILIPDLPGFGNSPLPEGQFSISDVAQAVYLWLMDQGLARTVVIGHSMGGYVTLALAKEHPEVLEGIGLFHSTAYADNAEKKDTRDKTIQFIKDHGVAAFAQSFVPQLFAPETRGQWQDKINEIIQMAASTPPATAMEYTRAMRDRGDSLSVMKDFEKPILVIGGEKDTVIPVEVILSQELLPKKAIVHVLQQVGHMGMIENKDICQQVITDFMEVCSLG